MPFIAETTDPAQTSDTAKSAEKAKSTESTDTGDIAAAVATAGPTETFLRVEKGNPDACELAALTAVLLARAAALGGAGEDAERTCRRTAGWRRLERRSGPSTPRSWRDDIRR
jgi:hypothetical protein